MAFLATAAAVACAPEHSNEALAASIERQVTAAHPDVPLERYARFYAREQDGSVSAIYLYSNVGDDPFFGKAGTNVWTSSDKLPGVHDGGCTVIRVRFDPGRSRLTSVECGVSG